MLSQAIRLVVGAVLLAVSGCGGAPAGEETAAETSPSYFFDRVMDVREALAGEVSEPRTLDAALPEGGAGSSSYTDLAVIGSVVRVVPGDGRRQVGDDEYELVPFDGPAADERDLVVTVAVDSFLGDPAPAADSHEITVRVGVGAGSDPTRFVAAMAQLDRVVLLLVKNDSRIYPPWYLSPILNGAGIGVVGPDGSLDFPGLGAKSDAFTDGIDTAAKLRRVMNTQREQS